MENIPKALEWPSEEQNQLLFFFLDHKRVPAGMRPAFEESLRLAANIVEPRLGNYLHLYAVKGKRDIINMYFRKRAQARTRWMTPCSSL